MLQKIKNTIREIGIMSMSLTLAFIIFIGLSISNAWTEPAVAPPAGNLAAPINVGSTAQNKAGQIGSTAGGAYGTGSLKIGNHTLNSNNNGWLYLGDGVNSVYANKGVAAGNLYANSNVYAGAYCDQASNCKTIAQMGGTTAGVRFASTSVAGPWNNSFVSAIASCNSDEVVTGGGYACDDGWLSTVKSFPSGNGWSATCNKSYESTSGMTVYAVCLKK